jgi:hypothetical protein
MSDHLIYHNPACGTSRNVLALMRHCGVEPQVLEYLKTPPTREALKAVPDLLPPPPPIGSSRRGMRPIRRACCFTAPRRHPRLSSWRAG